MAVSNMFISGILAFIKHRGKKKPLLLAVFKFVQSAGKKLSSVFFALFFLTFFRFALFAGLLIHTLHG